MTEADDKKKVMSSSVWGFRTKLTLFFISMLIVIQSITFLFVNSANINNAQNVISDSLGAGSVVLKKIMDSKTASLLENSRLLSSDYGFKSAYSTSDIATLDSAMANHLARIEEADVMMMLDLDYQLVTTTLGFSTLKGDQVEWWELIEEAEFSEYGESSGIVILNDKPYQMMVVPLLVPDLAAWIAIGFSMDEGFVSNLKKLTLTDISIFQVSNGAPESEKWSIVASTLQEKFKKTLNGQVANGALEEDRSLILESQKERFVTFISSLSHLETGRTVVVMQESLEKAIAPYRSLQLKMGLVFLGGLFLSAIGAILIAGTVTEPVLSLARMARKVQDGDLNVQFKTKQKDEVGQLAAAFNQMVKDLSEKEKVRDLLGKVVSPAIAEELMSKGLELGGEEKTVSVIFSDIRNFTGLCEGRAPKDILSILNVYLSEVSNVIERNGGVVDKYIGDAVMALVGAPLSGENDANDAVRAAMEMIRALDELNDRIAEQGFVAPIEIGVGVNTGNVVAGNMGSITRLNYTVIGDGVNLASRLEGLTKKYGVQLIVSDSTQRVAGDYLYRELDKVRVKGKKEPVAIYEPLCETGTESSDLIMELDAYYGALREYRNRNFRRAYEMFMRMTNNYPGTYIYNLYQERCALFLDEPPDSEWDGVYTHTAK